MERVYTIQTEQVLPVYELMEKMKELSSTRYIQVKVKHPTYHFFRYTSFQGVYVTQMKGYIAVKMPFFSSSFDFLTASNLLTNLHKITGGDIRDEKGTYKSGQRIWDGDIKDFVTEDIEILQQLLKINEKAIQFSGPFGWYEIDAKFINKVLLLKEPPSTKSYRIVNEFKKQYFKEFESLFCG